MKQSLLRQQAGFSLIQILIGVAVSAITISAIVAVMSQTMGEVKDADMQSMLDSEHANSMHRVTSLQNVISHFALQDTGIGSPLSMCLKGRGSGCAAFQVAPQVYQDAAGELNGFTGPSGRCTTVSFICNIEKSARYTWICPTDTECTKLVLKIRTEYRGTSTNRFLQFRENDIELSTRALLSRGQIDFSCSSSSLLIGVNYKTLRGICNQLTGQTSTTSSYPARTVGTGMESNPGSSSCSQGFRSVGLFGGSQSCN